MPEPTPITCRRWLRFSVRTLFVLMLLVSVPLAWKANRVQSQRQAVWEIRNAGGTIRYSYQRSHEMNAFDNDVKGAVAPGPAWIRSVVGDDFFADVVSVDPRMISLKPAPAALSDPGWLSENGLRGVKWKYCDPAVLQQLPELHFIFIDSSSINDATIEHLRRCHKLRQIVIGVPLDISDTSGTLSDTSDHVRKKLVTAMPQVDVMSVYWVEPLSEAELEAVQGSPMETGP